MQRLSRFLVLVFLASAVSALTSCADEKRVLKVVDAATVFDVRSMKPITRLNVGEEVEVLKRFLDEDQEPWLEVISTRNKKLRGLLRASKCAPVKEAVAATGEDEEQPRQIVLPGNPGAVTNLGFRILRSAPTDQVNPAVSPYGIWSNARFWLRAAKGRTLAQLEKQLGLQLEEDHGPTMPGSQSFQSVDRLLKRPEIELKAAYLETAKQWQLSILESTFNEPARVELNSWIKKWSMDRIEEFYTKDQWNPDAQLIFVNVASLDAQWVRKFDKNYTQQEVFHISSDDTVPAKMMLQQSRFRWFVSAKLDATGIILPYIENDLAALLFVPNTLDGIGGLMEQIDSDVVDEVLMTATDENVSLFLPRFKVDASLNLFEQLGMHGVLPEKPDFSKMADGETTISDFRQRIQLAVDEDGTRAAAVTSTTIVPSAVGRDIPKLVKADRPFLFLVMHLPTRTLLFATRLNRPIPTVTDGDESAK